VYLLAPTVVRIAPEELSSQVRARFGGELRRTGSFAQLCMLGAQACLEAAGGDGPLGVLWSSRLDDHRAMRSVLDESLKRGEPVMPFSFIGMQPHLAGALLAQRGHPVARSAHVYVLDDGWPLVLATARGWLAECERVLLGRVEESVSEGVLHRSDWCVLRKNPIAGAIQLEPTPDKDSSAGATATDWLERVAAWRAGAPLLLRGGDEAWRFTRGK
jgi:hypothetical protein